jgi:hypothetical protein
VADALRKLRRLFEGRAIDDARGIEDGEIGVHPDPDAPFAAHRRHKRLQALCRHQADLA